MPLIELQSDDIALRGSVVSNILRPLSRRGFGPPNKRQGGGREKLIIGASDSETSGSKFTDWRFHTNNPGYLANYYEIWSPFDFTHNLFFMEKAYLTIYKGDHEFLCLHCDPNGLDAEDETMISNYQRGPHLHFKTASQPIPKAHISLTNTRLNEILSNADTVTECIEWCIQMISDEVMKRVH